MEDGKRQGTCYTYSKQKKRKEAFHDPPNAMTHYYIIAYRNGGQNAFRNACHNESNKVDDGINPVEANNQRQEEEQQRDKHTDAGDNADKMSDLMRN